MPGQTFGERKTYLSIVQGTIRQNVPFKQVGDEYICEIPTAIRRNYELKDGTKGVKFELIFMDWSGRIRDMILKDGKFGETFEIVFDDAILRIGADSKYFDDFMMKLPNVKINQSVILHPYDFEGDGKQRTGISIEQNGVKVKSYYWNDVDSVSINGLPQAAPGAKNTYKKSDWQLFFLTRRNFLKNTLQSIVNTIEVEKIESVEDEEPLEEHREVDMSEIKDSEIVQEPKKNEQPDLSTKDGDVYVDGQKVPF